MLAKRYKYDGAPVKNLNTLQHITKKQIDQKVNNGIYKFESTKCPVCTQKNFEILSEKDRYGLYSPTVICRCCGLIQTNPRMTQRAYAKFYNFEYRKLYTGENHPTQKFFDEQYKRGEDIYTFLKDSGIFTKKSSGLSVLEVGCGAGGILQYFKKQGFNVHGIDLGEEYLDFGRKKYNLNLYAGTIESCAPPQSFDIVIYSHVLEHILDLKKELSHIKHILSGDGALYIELPGVKNLMHSYNKNFLRSLQNAHMYYFTLTTLRNILEQNGFELVTGDETIKSIFRKKKSNFSASAHTTNDYSTVMIFLKKLEKIIFCRELGQKPILYIVKMLRFFRIYNTIRSIKRIFK